MCHDVEGNQSSGIGYKFENSILDSLRIVSIRYRVRFLPKPRTRFRVRFRFRILYNRVRSSLNIRFRLRKRWNGSLFVVQQLFPVIFPLLFGFLRAKNSNSKESKYSIPRILRFDSRFLTIPQESSTIIDSKKESRIDSRTL